MKKILLPGVFLLLTTFAVAQDQGTDDFRKFRFGLKASPNIGWFKPDEKGFASRGAKLSFSYGLTTEFGLGNNYSFLTGLEITSLGGKLAFPDSTNYYIDNAIIDSTKRFMIYERNYQVQYVDLPLMLKMKTNEIGYMTYFGQFGFTLSGRTKAVADDKGKFYTASEAEQTDIKINDDTGLFRVGLNIGAGTEYNFAGKTSLVVSVNYNNGFTNVLKKKSVMLRDPNGAFLNQKAMAKYISLSVGILF